MALAAEIEFTKVFENRSIAKRLSFVLLAHWVVDFDIRSDGWKKHRKFSAVSYFYHLL